MFWKALFPVMPSLEDKIFRSARDFFMPISKYFGLTEGLIMSPEIYKDKVKFYLLCRILRHNFILSNSILLQSFIHGAYQEFKNHVLSGTQLNFSICSG